MPSLPTQETILPLIQLSITPVILISGLGSLVLSMTNRLGRIVDRTRILAASARQASGAERANLVFQIEVMFRRAKIMRLAMTMITTSMFTSGLLIVCLFFSAIFQISISGVILGVFVLALLFMLAGLAAFIRDVFVSLKALHAEVMKTVPSIEE